MLDLVQNYGKNPYKFDDGEDWSHEIPPLELCNYLPLWDIRVIGPDDHKYDYGDVAATDDGQFNYEDLNDIDWRSTDKLRDFDGNDETEEDYDLMEMLDLDENPYEYLVPDFDGGDVSDPPTRSPMEDLDFNTLLYSIPEEYANIYALTVYVIARILEDEIIKRTGDYKAKYEVHNKDYPEADAYMNIHVGINPRMNKVYVEYMPNFRMKVLFGDERNRLETVIANRLKQFYNLTTHNHFYKVEIIMPEDNITFCCDSSEILTCHTIGYWKSFYDHWCFLEDREEVKLDIAKKGFGYNRKEFYDKVHAINRKYEMDGTKNTIVPLLFTEYKEMYKEEFGYELPDFYDAFVRIAVKYDVLYRDGMYLEAYINKEERSEEVA